MNLERLRAVQAEEREADSLRALPDTFYREVADYIEGLREERAEAAEAAADPFGADDVRRLTDEIETAEEVAEAIYERRVGKLVKRASLAAAGMPSDEEGLTTEEAELFADLVAQIEDHRAEVLASFDGEREARGRGGEAGPSGSDTSDPPPDEGRSTTGQTGDRDSAIGRGAHSAERDEVGTRETSGDADPAFGVGDAMGDDPGETWPTAAEDSHSADAPPPPPDEPPGDGDDGFDGSDATPDPEPGSETDEDAGEDLEESTDGGDPERVTLRITRDVGEVFGVDERVYDLASEDVVTLPAANAKPLLDRDAAEEI